MKAYIFMNHHIREKNSTEPWITIQSGKRRIYANDISIAGPCRIMTGLLKKVETHDVKAWIECDSEDIMVIP